MDEDSTSLEQVIDGISTAGTDENNKVSLGAILDAVGRRSFGPLLLVAGLITVAPLIGDIPGVPTIMGIFVLLTAGQLLFHREHFWLPDWILKQSVTRDNLCRALEWMRPPARFLDRWLRPRRTRFIRGTGLHVIAIVCIAIALAMPAMEFVPFSANGAGAALTAFGLALVTHDGVMALIALTVTVSTIGLVVYSLV